MLIKNKYSSTHYASDKLKYYKLFAFTIFLFISQFLLVGFQLPTNYNFDSSPAVLKYPSNLTITASVTDNSPDPINIGPYVTIPTRNAQPTLTEGATTTNDDGTTTASFLYPGSPLATQFTPNIPPLATRAPSILLFARDCQVDVPCLNRGQLNLNFSAPVINPHLHVQGIGGVIVGNYNPPQVDPKLPQLTDIVLYSTQYNFVSAQPTTNPNFVLLSGSSSLGVSTPYATIGPNSSATQGTTNQRCTGSFSVGTVAACGSVEVQGTLEKLALRLDIRSHYYGTDTLPPTTMVVPTPTSLQPNDRTSFVFTVDEDFGDAPSSYEQNTPAYHTWSDLHLGSQVDVDSPNVNVTTLTASPNAVAAGADNNGTNGDGADEDAFTSLPALVSGASYALTVPISGASRAGKVCGWIDTNDSGTFETTERVCADFVSGASSVSLLWPALPALTATKKYARFRASYDTTGVQSPMGGLASGEVEDYSLTISPSYKLSGVIFEDVNYGGGAGRNQTAAIGVGTNAAVVELYNSAGALVATTTTANDGTKDGAYSFANLAAGNYYVRVVSDTINSTRTGSDGSELAVQTFRTDGTTAVTNEVGGHAPTVADGGANTGTETLNTTTYKLSGGVNVQSLQPVTIGSAAVTGVDFGFNFDTIVNTNDAGQGSLRQFILNSNLLANTGLAQQLASAISGDYKTGDEVSIFMIPSSANNGTGGNANTALIQFAAALPAMTDSATKIDGRTQTLNISNSNLGQIGSGGTVGTDNLPLTKVNRPEITLDLGKVARLQFSATQGAVRGVTVYHCLNGLYSGCIAIDPGANSAFIEHNLIGSYANGSEPPVDETVGLVLLGQGEVRNNYFAYHGEYHAIIGHHVANVDTADNSIFENNELHKVTLLTDHTDATAIYADNVSFQGNLIEGMATGVPISNISGRGIETWYGPKNVLIRNNTITGMIGAAVLAGGSTTSISVEHNKIFNNQQAGVLVHEAATAKISQNSFWNNGTLGVDLEPYQGIGDKVTLNDANDADNGGNNLLNFPQFKQIQVAGSNLVLSGCAPTGSTIELFEADVSPTSSSGVTAGANKFTKTQDYGEGERYLQTFTEGVGEDTATPVNCSTFVDADNNNATGMSPFQWTIPMPAGVMVGDKLTATTTVSGTSTSEFSAATTVMAFDHGDAPSNMTSIDATLTNTYGDAWHTITGSVRLGSTIDAESTAQSTGLLADGDGADEDGVTFPMLGSDRVLFAAQSNTLSITTGSNGYLNAWIDWNQDGDWNDAGEQIATNVAMTTGSNTLSVAVNNSIPHGVTYARFRFTSSSVTNPSPLGAAADGEVEDYRFNILLTRPSGACLGIGNSGFEQPGGFTGLYKPTEDLVPYWSTVPNSPSDGASFASRNSIELWQNGFLGVPSYEGQYFAELNADVAGALYQDSETSPGTVLHWSFAHRGRAGNDTINLKIGSPGAEVIIASFTTGTSGWKLYSGTYTVPAGQYITRFAFQANGAGSYGNFVDSIDFKSACPDWSDAPASYGDASHQQVLSMKLGTSLTTDAGPYHDANANADPSDDGATFSTLALGRTGTINVAVSNSTGYLQAWFDLNTNGSFDAGEQIAINARDGSTGDADGAVNGVIKLNLPIPVTYPANYIFSRFRWSSTTGLGATGDANDGEVEDYKTTVIRTDFGDAPASYGNAVHNITTNLYLGLNALDAEAVASPPLNGTGDNITGVNDENGVVNLPVLSSASMGASVNVIATNTTTSKAWLVGWLDWNQNGIFDAIEAATVPVEVGSSQKVVGLTWKGFSGLTTGTTYLRLRLTTDPNIATGKAPTSQAQGIAADGEVEDYAIVVNDGGYELSGQVFLDTNVNAANDSEAGIKDVSIVLYNTVTHTCVATKTDANGQYHFINVANGSYELYEAAAEKIKAPKVCPPVAHDSNGYQSSTANSFAVTVNNNDETGLDFGDVKTPIFSIDNQKSILPNTTITYPHTFRSFVDGIVSFSVLDEQATPANLDWGTSILLDNNCDGKLGQGDAPLNNALAVSVDTKVCILVKVHAPSAASEGAQHSLVIQSDFQFGAGDVISNDIQTHTDFTTTIAGTPQQPVDGAGKLQLEKSVWNVTRNIDGTVALPGETLRYTLHYENIGNGLLNDLAIQDSVPEFTQLVPNSLGCGTTPPELTTCTPQVSATSLEWVFTGQLKAGSKGIVSYQVIVE